MKIVLFCDKIIFNFTYAFLLNILLFYVLKWSADGSYNADSVTASN